MLASLIETFKSAGLWLEGAASGQINSVLSDSRKVLDVNSPDIEDGHILFCARRGPTQDGHEFLVSLQNNPRISVFIVEKKPVGFSPSQPVIVVRDSTHAMALAVKALFKNPTHNALTVAVTGTNGKTTTTFLLQSLFQQIDRRVARIGTIETHFENYRVESSLTTPDFSELQKIFADLKTKGADSFIFEASSHALEQRRLLGVEIDAALFTNLSPEHLDYHRTMEKYFEAKKKLFAEMLASSTKKEKWAVIPEDGVYGSRLADEMRLTKGISVVTWSMDPRLSADLQVQEWKTDLSGSSWTVSAKNKNWASISFRSDLVGKHNIENCMGVIALGYGMRLDAEKIQKALANHLPVAGRLERVQTGLPGTIFVDYAHTPDALENVLMTLRPLTKGKLRVVFGCGGDRDRTKRPKMGAIAELYGDELFVTSDNPRTEDPDSIIQEILTGVQGLKPVHVNSDRARSIGQSIDGLAAGDVVLIAGKGHENYQIIGTKKYPFDDRAVVIASAKNLERNAAC